VAKNSQYRDQRGHSVRIYQDVYTSHAFNALAPLEVLAYLALLRELRKSNNGDLSLTLTRAKQCGIKHHVTLARSLRALCAVGLIALTRKGGCDRGGRRLASLYRVTDIECYEMPGKNIEAQKATCDYKKIQSIEQAKELIKKFEQSQKKCVSKNPRPSNDSNQVNE